jgi:hypothetical protein
MVRKLTILQMYISNLFKVLIGQEKKKEIELYLYGGEEGRTIRD